MPTYRVLAVTEVKETFTTYLIPADDEKDLDKIIESIEENPESGTKYWEGDSYATEPAWELIDVEEETDE